MPRLAPYQAGEVVRLRPGRRGSRLHVVAPDGMELVMPATTYVDLWLAQTGSWTYRWDDGLSGRLEVVAGSSTGMTHPSGPHPPMKMAARPRY